MSPVIGRKYIPEKYAKLDKKKGFYNTLLSSTIHALIVSSGTGYLLITGGLGNNPVYSKSPFGFAVMQISLGYFLADFIVCLLDKNLRQDFGSLAHHVAGIIGIALHGALLSGKVYVFHYFSLPFRTVYSISKCLLDLDDA